MYHKRQKGQVADVYEMLSGRHTRRGRGDRLHIRAGDTCHPTEQELEKFPDKFRLVPEKRAKVVVDDEEIDDDENENDDDELTRDDFSSASSYKLWLKNDQPDMSGVDRTGHGGSTFSKKDVEGVVS